MTAEDKQLLQERLVVAARTAHEANRIVCEFAGEKSQPTWDNAPEWQKASAWEGVHLVWNNPSVTPQQLHESWSKQKVSDGWVYGFIKDAEKKTHPCLVPYEELPEAQKAKDFMFGAVVRAVLQLPQLPFTTL